SGRAGRVGIGVALLHTAGQNAVNVTRGNLGWRGGAGSGDATGAKISQRGGGNPGRIGVRGRDFAGVDGGNAPGGSRFIGGNTRAQQVRDRDGSNDQDDRHHDQQFDQ